MRIEINQIRRIIFKGMPGRNFNLPGQIQNRIFETLKRHTPERPTVGIAADFDRTLVNTDEKNRIFPSIQTDTSHVLDPIAALGICGFPTAVISGNKPSYIDTLFTEGYRNRLEEQARLSTMERFRAFSQNSTWQEAFNTLGEKLPDVSAKYAQQYLFQSTDIDTIENSFRLPLSKAIGSNFMMEKPLIIRPGGSNEILKTYGPIFENRNGTQLSWIAVPGPLRQGIIKGAIETMPQEFPKKYKFEPGGQYSIDINHINVEKPNGARDFMDQFGLELLLYFGDSVYERDGYEGNDLAVRKVKNAFVFAVDPDQSEIPEGENIIKAGPTPDATYAWMTWIFANYVSIRFATQGVHDSEKNMIMKAIINNHLQEKLIENYQIINNL
jgi:hypothetical protein